MSLLPNATNVNLNEYFFLRGNGQSLNVSTLNANTISTNALTAASVSTVQCDAEYINASTISTISLDLDGQLLTANPTELLLNGVPLVTTSNISSLSDWSLDPAISTVQMNGNNLYQAGQISTNSIVGGSAFFGQLMAINSMFLSTYTSTISTQMNVADAGFYSTISTGYLTGGDVGPSTIWGQPSSFYFNNSSTINTENIVCSTLTAADFISTPSLVVSSINGSEFTSTGITVQVAGVSSLVANSISSIGAELRTALVSTLQFNPSFSPNLDVNLGLGSLFGNLAGAAAGGLGVLVGAAGLGTGIAALAQGRQTNNVNSNVYETVNGTTQLQVSTLGAPITTFYRANTGIPADVEPGLEVFISTILPPGTTAIRSVSDPLNTVSTPNSTIQSFGQWVALPEIPIASTVSSFSQLFTSSIQASTVQLGSALPLTLGADLKQFQPSAVGFFQAGGPGLLQMNAVEFWTRGDATDPNFGVYSRSGANRALYTDSNLDPHVLLYTNDSNATITTVSTNTITGKDFTTVDVDASLAILGGNNLVMNNGQITWQNGASIYEASAGRLYLTAGSATNIDLEPTQISFNEGGAGGLMRFFDNHLEVSAISTLNVQALQGMATSTLTVSSVNGGIPYTTAFPPSVTDSFSTLKVSTLTDNGSSTINIFNANVGSLSFNNAGDIIGVATNYINLQAQGTGGELAGLVLNAGSGGTSSNYATGPLFLNASTINMSTNQVRANNISTNVVSLTELDVLGLSTITFSTATAAGSVGQPAGRLVLGGNDLDLVQQDLWCQQIRLGFGNPGGSGQSEIIFYDPTGATTRAFNIGGSDRTIRVQSTINSAQGGYLLDTLLNPPLFSTINAGTSTALVSYFPSTSFASIGYSTLTVMPPLTYLASVYDSTTQLVAGANTSTPLVWNTTGLNLGGYTVGTSTLTAPVAGVYELSLSAQFATTSGGTNEAEFWLTKNGNAVAQTNSRVAIVNNGDTLGTVSIFDTAAPGDKYGWMFYSADNNMSALAVAAGAVPAIPSVIFNAKRIG